MNDREIAQKLATEQTALRVTPQMNERLSKRLSLGMSTSHQHAAPRRSFAMALVLMLVTSCAFAVGLRLGMLDFMGRLAGSRVSNDAYRYITEHDKTFSDMDDTFSVRLRQTAFDGKMIFAVLDIAPVNEATLLIPLDARMDDPVGNLQLDCCGTIHEYCENHGYSDTWRVSAQFSPESLCDIVYTDGAWHEDGYYTLYVVVQLSEPADFVDETLDILFIHYFEEQEIRIPCTVSLTKATDECVIGKKVSIPVDSAGIVIDHIEMEKRTFETWIEIYYTVTDEDVYNDRSVGVEFRVLDENGRALPMGASGAGITDLLSNEDGETGAMYRSRQSVYMPIWPQRVDIEVFCPGEEDTLGTFSVVFD